jgi:nucleoside-diphosphate-sugar epimerase
MRVLLTGANGFIGRAFLSQAAALGIDCLPFPGRLHELPDFSIKVEAVVHLAAVTRGSGEPEARLALFETNVLGTQAVLDYCAAARAGLVLASTSGVYGRQGQASLLGEQAPLDPASDYALSKWLAEGLCRRHCERTGTAGIALRFFNVFGPRQAQTFVVSEVIHRLLDGLPVVLRSPHAVRDFLAVDDVVLALAAALGALKPGNWGVYNIGSGQGTRVIDLVDMVARVFGAEAAVDVSGADYRVDRVVADISKAASELGWRPRIALGEGLEMICRDMGPRCGG